MYQTYRTKEKLIAPLCGRRSFSGDTLWQMTLFSTKTSHFLTLSLSLFPTLSLPTRHFSSCALFSAVVEITHHPARSHSHRPLCRLLVHAHTHTPLLADFPNIERKENFAEQSQHLPKMADTTPSRIFTIFAIIT